MSGLAAAGFPGWHPHPDTWLLVVVLEGAYLAAVRAGRRRSEGSWGGPTTRRQVAAFTAGVLTIWVASDWPVHDLAEGYLYSAHMVQHLLMTLVAAPLLLLGTPAWLGRRLLSNPRLLAVVRRLARPVAGLIQFNLVLVLSHWPLWVDATLRNHPLHFVAHALLLVSAVLMWLPVVSPVPEIPRVRPPLQMLYLFLQTVVPTVPASFLTFGARPLYRCYESVPRLWGISALDDMRTAGLIMKVGAGFYLWILIAVIFFRWYAREEQQPDVLLWEDVERELRQLS